MKSLAEYLQVESIESLTYEDIKNLKIGNSIPLKAFLEAARDEYIKPTIEIKDRDTFTSLVKYKNLRPNEGESIVLYVNTKNELCDIRTITGGYRENLAKQFLHTDYNTMFVIDDSSVLNGRKLQSLAITLNCNLIDRITIYENNNHVVCITKDDDRCEYDALDEALPISKNTFTSQELSIIKQYHLDKVKEITHVKQDEDILSYMKEGLKYLPEEEAYLVTLTKNASVKDVILLGKGDYNKAVLSECEINNMLLDDDVDKALVIHNHPSGNSKPSQNDIFLIEGLCEKANIFGKTVEGYVVAHDGYSVCNYEQELHHKQVKKPNIVIHKKAPQKGMEL